MLLGYQCSSSQVQGCSEHPVSFYCIDAVSGGLSRVAVLTSLEVIENWTLRFLKQSISRALLGLQTSLQQVPKLNGWHWHWSIFRCQDELRGGRIPLWRAGCSQTHDQYTRIHLRYRYLYADMIFFYRYSKYESMVTRCFDQTSFRKQAYAGIVYFLPFGRRLL